MSNVSTYIPTYININNLQGGYIAVYDDAGSQYLYQNTTDGIIELPYESNNTWTYKIARYGSRLIQGSFIINRDIGGTVNINPSYVSDNFVFGTLAAVSAYNTFSTTQNIYDYLSYYRTTSAGISAGDLNQYISTLDVGSKSIILLDTASQPFSYDGSTFTLKSSFLSGNAVTTTGGINLSGNSYVSNITLNANVSSTLVLNLTSVNINGTLTYNTDTPTNIIYTNTNINTVKNDGAAKINIKRLNSTIINASDAEIENYVPTYLSLTLLGGYIAIYDDNGIQQHYQNTNETIELPYSANNTWTYKIARFGYKLISGTFTINRSSGGTVAIAPIYELDINVTNTQLSAVSAYSSFNTTSQIYDYLSYYRTTETGLSFGDLNLYSSTLDVGSNNIIFFDSASQTFNYDGTTFILRSPSLSGAAIKTTGTISLSGTSSISNIELTTNVLDQTPNDLTNVRINGILKYNTDSSSTIIYTNTFVDTVVNDGFGNILITRLNSTINNATDPQIQNYTPNIVNVYPGGGSVAIYNNLGIRQYFLTTESTLLLPFDATGTWSYRVAKYGYYPIYQQFTINTTSGATINIDPIYVQDFFITEPSPIVASAYTDLNTPDKIHDYLSYFQTLSSGIDYGDLESESFGTIIFNSNLTLDATASSVVTYSGGTLTLKSTSLVGSTIVSINGNFTQANGNTLSDNIKIRAANLDSEIYFANVDYITLFPSAIERDNNTNGNITITTSIYRYKYGATVLGIPLENFVYAKVNTGGSTILVSSPIETGSTYIDYGTTGNFQIVFTNLDIINTGVQKASKLIPHTTNL